MVNICLEMTNMFFRNDDIVLKSLLKHDTPQNVSTMIGKDDFIYGICRGACSYYNPYDLRRVKRAAIPPDAIFYTITHDNVMMVSLESGIFTMLS